MKLLHKCKSKGERVVKSHFMQQAVRREQNLAHSLTHSAARPFAGQLTRFFVSNLPLVLHSLFAKTMNSNKMTAGMAQCDTNKHKHKIGCGSRVSDLSWYI